MRLSINMEELSELMKNFNILTDFRVVIYDDEFCKISSYPKKSCSFCSLLKDDEILKERCRACDRKSFALAKESGKPAVYKCHAGLTEAVFPIKMNDITVGYLMFGQTIIPEEKTESRDKILNYCNSHINDRKTLEKYYNDLICKSEAQISAAAKIMEIAACYLCKNNVVSIDNNNIIGRLTAYVDDNLGGNLSVNDICKALNIGRTKLFEISKRYFGVSITGYIRKRRITAASDYLLKNDCSVAQAADFVGITDYNYFSKIFKTETGFSPKQYKQKYMK